MDDGLAATFSRDAIFFGRSKEKVEHNQVDFEPFCLTNERATHYLARSKTEINSVALTVLVPNFLTAMPAA